MSQYETATDRLVNAIQSIQLGRASGVLTARRGEGATQEEGFIVFVNGQVAEASVGRRTGSGALNWLSTWGRCRFSFVPSDTSPIATPSLPPSPGAIGDQHRNTGSYPRMQAPTSDKRSGSLLPSGPHTSAAGQPNLSAPIAIIPSTTQPLGEALHLIEQSRLSRIHKHLFLLIDGHRSVTELVRLTGKNQDEVHALLRDLLRTGVIRIGEK
jgi:Domain of unknown function (DUF4388)